MRVEEIQRKVDEEEFMNTKQRLLKVHKKRIQYVYINIIIMLIIVQKITIHNFLYNLF